MISLSSEAFAESRVARGNVFAAFFKMEQRPAGVDHGAAGHTDRRRSAARNMRVCKRHSAVNQKIKIRRTYFIIAERVYRPVALIVRQQKQNVRTFFRS